MALAVLILGPALYWARSPLNTAKAPTSSAATATDTPTASSVESSTRASTLALRDQSRARLPYVVKEKEFPVKGGRQDVTLNLIFSRKPTLQDAYEAVGAEVAAYEVEHSGPETAGVEGYAQVGDPDKPTSWAQVKDSPKGWVAAWYDRKTNAVIKHFETRDVVVPNVLGGAAAQAAADRAQLEERGELFEKKKRTAMGLVLLKQQLRNPGSFELIEASISSTGASCYTYRAQNGFGGFNLEHAVFDVLLRTPGQDDFTRAWNKDCGGKSLTPVTEDVKTMLKLAGSE